MYILQSSLFSIWDVALLRADEFIMCQLLEHQVSSQVTANTGEMEVQYEVASWHTFLRSRCGILFSTPWKVRPQPLNSKQLYKHRGLSALTSYDKKTYL